MSKQHQVLQLLEVFFSANCMLSILFSGFGDIALEREQKCRRPTHLEHASCHVRDRQGNPSSGGTTTGGSTHASGVLEELFTLPTRQPQVPRKIAGIGGVHSRVCGRGGNEAGGHMAPPRPRSANGAVCCNTTNTGCYTSLRVVGRRSAGGNDQGVLISYKAYLDMGGLRPLGDILFSLYDKSVGYCRPLRGRQFGAVVGGEKHRCTARTRGNG